MAEVTNELMYELMKSIRGEVVAVRSEVRELKSEMQAMRGHMLATQQDIANIYSILGDHSHRLERIERRLELVEA
jgi:DNA anti-recombination protein RmuC